MRNKRCGVIFDAKGAEKMKYEALFTVEISVGSERVANHKIKAHNITDVIEKLAEKYSSDHEGHSQNE